MFQISILSTLSKKRRVIHRYIFFEDRGMPSWQRRCLDVRKACGCRRNERQSDNFSSADNDLSTNQPMTLEKIAETNSQVEVGLPEPEEAKEIEVKIVEEEQPVSVLDAL
uniref:Uncharacterized protein n=1 Tax=Ditylenchus dipsaci TaxID=166011 RepID=A0A915CU98_9BILA